MRELSLFTGAGGGILGTKLLGWKTRGYVEIDEYCQKIIAQRIKDGIFDEAPIFGDIRAFISEGFAKRYRGMVDVVTAGFPCQPFSVAGKRRGKDDERNRWPETIECIKQIRPKFAFLENVPNLLVDKYFGTILGDLAKVGMDAKWCLLGSGETNGFCVGKRLWILAKANTNNGGSNDEIHPRTNIKIEIPRRTTWPSIQDASKEWLLSNSFIVSKNFTMASYVDEFKAIGNGQDPTVVARAWEVLTPP